MSNEDELEEIKRKKMEELMKQSVTKLPNEVVEISGVDHFNQLVNDFKDNLIIVDFWAEWCRPCLAFAPHFKALQKDFYNEGVVFAKLNVDYHPAIAQQFQVSGIPTTLFIHNKKLVHRQVGMLPKAQFAQVIRAVLKKINKD